MNIKVKNPCKDINLLKILAFTCNFLTFCPLAPTAHASGYTISTIAGEGEYDSGAPNVYNGTGTSVFADTGNPTALSIALAQPYAIVRDSTYASLLFIDRDHSAIRRISASGSVSTILSGFNINTSYPQYLTIDPSTGSLYATDGQNVFCIPKSGSAYGTPNILATYNTSSSSGTNSGVLGWSVAPTYDTYCWYDTNSASPSFSNPQGIAFAPLAGGVGPYLYVGGANNIFQIDLNSTNVTGGHYAYTEIVNGLNYPAGLALNVNNTSLFVTDNPDQGSAAVIRCFSVPSISDTAAGSDDIVAGQLDNPASASDCIATSSGLSPSANIAVDSDGGLYIADTGNNAIHYVPATTSGSYTAGYIYTIAGGGSSASNGIAATAAQLYGPRGLFVDSDKTIFITEGDSNNSSNFIRRIAFSPAAVSLAPSTKSQISALTVPYYSAVGFSGGGTAKLITDNSTKLFGGVVLSGAGTTVEINQINALGGSTSLTNILTMGTGTGLQAGASLASASGDPSTIPVPIHYAGSIIIDTADDTGTTHSLETAAITSTASGANTITVKGGGKYTPGGDYTAGGTDALAVVDSGTTLSLTNANYAPALVKLGGGTILGLSCDLPWPTAIEID